MVGGELPGRAIQADGATPALLQWLSDNALAVTMPGGRIDTYKLEGKRLVNALSIFITTPP